MLKAMELEVAELDEPRLHEALPQTAVIFNGVTSTRHSTENDKLAELKIAGPFLW